MGTDFPAGIDDFGSVSEHELARASHMNDVRLAIEALEAELGVRDSAVATSVRSMVNADGFMHLVPVPLASRPPDVEGNIYADSDDNHIYCYLGGSWKQLDN